jgi:hypothetical protein
MWILQKPEFWYTIISIAAAFIIYYFTLNKRSSKRFILKLFKENQKLSLTIQQNLSDFITRHNAYNSIAFPERNITYGHFLEQMKVEFDSNLTDTLYQVIKKRKFSKPEIDSTIDSLNKQNEALRLVDIDMKLVIRKANS